TKIRVPRSRFRVFKMSLLTSAATKRRYEQRDKITDQFVRGHSLDESDQIRDTQYRPARFIAADADVVEMFRWLAAIPQQSQTAGENCLTNGATSNISRVEICNK
ncbi:MAG: hypothetical protein ABIR24_07125, partial [Verrucomicrobiota bacterium]